MDEIVLQLIKQMEEEKKAKGIGPEHITFISMMLEIRNSLNNLYKANKIQSGDTMNDKWIKST